MRSCCLRWDHIDKTNTSSNHKLLYQDVMSDMKMLRQFIHEVESTRWISLNNATEWYPLACALLSRYREGKLLEVAKILRNIKYIPALDVDDDIFLQNLNEKIFADYNWQALISAFSDNMYILSAAMVLEIKFDDESFLRSLDETKINMAIIKHYRARIGRNNQ